jgi:hypothetical protein
MVKAVLLAVLVFCQAVAGAAWASIAIASKNRFLTVAAR